MQRLIGFILLVVGGLAIASWLKRQSQRPHHKDTFRPDENSNGRNNARGSNANQDTMSLVGKRKAAQTRDALTGAPVNLDAKVWQCQNCQSLYHDDSVQALVRDNHGQCTQCKTTHRQQVVFIDD